MVGYVEADTKKTKFFCQNTNCRNFMTIVKPKDMPTTFRPKNVNCPFMPRKLP